MTRHQPAMVDWLMAVLDETERVAREACGRDGAEPPAEGERWHWVNPDSDQPLTIEDASEWQGRWTYPGEGSLRSVEEYPTPSVGSLPAFAIHSAEEMPVPVAIHIARHDPRSVLARVEATRQLVAMHGRGDDYLAGEWCPGCDGDRIPCQNLRLLAWGHRHDAPGFDPAWTPDGVSVP